MGAISAHSVSLASSVSKRTGQGLVPEQGQRSVSAGQRLLAQPLSTFGDLGLEPDARCDAETWSLVTAAGLALDVAHKALRRESDEMSAREETSTDVAA